MDQEQKLKVLAYARIIDIHNEAFDLTRQMLKLARRWKYRPTKTFAGSLARTGRVIAAGMKTARLLKEKQHLLNLLKPSFAPGDLVGGGTKGRPEEIPAVIIYNMPPYTSKSFLTLKGPELKELFKPPTA